MTLDVLSIPELQYNLKRDPETYKPDFMRYFDQYKCLEQSFICAPSQNIPKLSELLLFLSQVVQLYPDYVEAFTTNVMQTLLSRSFGMHPEMRLAFMKAFIRLKTKDFITLNQAVDVAFKLHRCQDKQVRQSMRIFLVNDIKRLNRKQKTNKLNASVQAFLAKTIRDNNATVAREAVLLLIILFKKGVWNDARTANLIADACLAKRKKVYTPPVRLFIGQDKSPEEKDSDSDSDADVNKDARIRQLKLGHRVGLKTKNREKRLDRSIKNVNKAETRKATKNTKNHSFLALGFLRDAQTFAERLFRKLERCTDCFEVRLLLLDLITRLVAVYKLQIFNLYPFLQRFLRPHQREVTRLLLFTAQASHDEVPPDVMEPVVRTIADNFVTERASSEAIAVGLNAVREICTRCPYAVTPDLLSDLVLYRTYRNKNVVAAARSLIRLFRVLNPSVLPRKERGRPTEAQLEVLAADIANNPASTAVGLPALSFGQSATANSVPGAEALVLADAMLADRSARSARSGARRSSASSSTKSRLESDQRKQPLDAPQDSNSIEGNSEAADDSCDEDEEMASAHELVSEEALAETDTDEESGESSDQTLGQEEGLPRSLTFAIGKMKSTPGLLTSKAIEMASSRMFTQEEFEVMRKFQTMKKKRFASAGAGGKRSAAEESELVAAESDEEAEAGGGGGADQLVSLNAITRLVKRPKQSKADRLEAVHEGRLGREKYGYKVNRMNPHASTTNREKTKHKAFSMVKHKVKQKAKRSFRDKQIALRDQLKRQLKHVR